jgi:gas vesicle protein
MSQQDNFFSGFLIGAVLGGAVGGVLGVLVASRLADQENPASEETFVKLGSRVAKDKKRPLKAPTEQSIEIARRGLEDKIAQLNEAIDDVRQQLSGVNSIPRANGERAIAQDS